MSFNIDNIKLAFDSCHINEIELVEREKNPGGKLFEHIRKFYGSGKKTKLIKNFGGLGLDILVSRWGEKIYCYVMNPETVEPRCDALKNMEV